MGEGRRQYRSKDGRVSRQEGCSSNEGCHCEKEQRCQMILITESINESVIVVFQLSMNAYQSVLADRSNIPC